MCRVSNVLVLNWVQKIWVKVSHRPEWLVATESPQIAYPCSQMRPPPPWLAMKCQRASATPWGSIIGTDRVQNSRFIQTRFLRWTILWSPKELLKCQISEMILLTTNQYIKWQIIHKNGPKKNMSHFNDKHTGVESFWIAKLAKWRMYTWIEKELLQQIHLQAWDWITEWVNSIVINKAPWNQGG